jgi:hypothetical protein
MNELVDDNYCFGQFESLDVTSHLSAVVTNLNPIHRLSSSKTPLNDPIWDVKEVLIAFGDDSANFRGSKECTGSVAKGLFIRGILRFSAWLGYYSKRLPTPHTDGSGR